MNAVIVYESLWGNTAAVALAIVKGIGPQARVLSTAQATTDVLAGIDLLVAGAPILAFSLPIEKVREGIRANPAGPRRRRPLASIYALLARTVGRRARPGGGV